MRILSLILVGILFISCVRYDWGIGEKRLITESKDVMRVLSIDNKEDAKILRMHSDKLSIEDIKTNFYDTLVKKMILTVTDSLQDGVGISAPQIGILRRLAIVQRFDKPGEPFEAYPNISVIEKRGEMISGREGCLSIPDQIGNVKRSHDITISYTSPYTFSDTTEIVRGYTAVIFQHECDHLDGILYTDRIWEDKESSWYSIKKNNDFVDVFYIPSTDVIVAYNSDSCEVYRSLLTEEDKKSLFSEMNLVASKIFYDSVNFIAPYYHQFTYNSITLPEDQFKPICEAVYREINQCFDYYMRHINGGRKFILAGFSQGAMCAVDIIKHMDDDTFSKMVAAYIIGYGLNEDDLKCSKIIPAKSRNDKGVTITFNTVKDTESIWQIIYNDSKCCINPINWRTDSSISEFNYKGQTYKASIDTTKHVIVVSEFSDTLNYPFTPLWTKGCLHHYDLLFYSQSLSENVKERSYR